MAVNWFADTFEPLFHEIVNYISLISAFITILLVGVLAYYRPHVINRVSLRFQAIIAFVDILRHIRFIITKQPKGHFCIFMAFFGFFINHIYTFINVIMALNIQMLYFHNFRPRKSTEMFLIFGAVNAALVIDLIPIARDFYGVSKYGSCYIQDGAKDEKFFKIFLLYVVQLTAILYILILFVAVSIFLFLRKEYIEKKFPDKTFVLFGELVNAREFIKKLYFKMALYPLSSFVCFFPYIARGIYYDIYNIDHSWLIFFDRFGTRVIGTLNLIALLFDPHFQLAVKNIKRNGLEYNIDDKEARADIDLKTVRELKRIDKCLIEFPGQESIEFKEFVKFV